VRKAEQRDEATTNTLGDRPIKQATGDRLGRGPFVVALAAHLLRTPPGDSAVFALYGAWGSGKTSILNLVDEELAKRDNLTILRFNPWLFSGTDQLVAGFFRELASQLAERTDKKLQKVAAALEGLGDVLNGLGGLPGVGGFAKAGASVTAVLSKGAAKRGNALPKSLEAQRRQLVEVLRELQGRVIVLIDDIDRLRHEEIRDIMRLVRLVADLPHTVYLLAFDRVRVVEALSESGQSGQAYIEKIVQVALQVPEAAPVDLAKLLADEVNKFVSGIEYNRSDLENVYHQILRPLFRTARDIRRFANALPFVFSLLGDEVAGPDLLGLEALRAIRPDLAEQLAQLSHLLTHVSDRSYGQARQDREKAAFDEFIKSAGNDANTLRELCRQLFPASRRFIDNHYCGTDSLPRWRRGCRVAHDEVLRIYLEGRPPPGVLPNALVRRAVESIGKPEWAVMPDLDSAQLESLLWRLGPYVEDLDPERAVRAAAQIAGIRHRLRSDSLGFGDPFGADTAYRGLLLALIKRATGDGNRSTAALERAIALAPNLTAHCALVARVGDRADSQIGTKVDSDRLQAALGEAVATAPADQLAYEYHVDRLLLVAVSTGKMTPNDVASKLTEPLLISLLRAHLSSSFKQNLGEAAIERRDVLAWEGLCQIMPEKDLVERVNCLAALKPNLDERAASALELALGHAVAFLEAPTVAADPKSVA
jgi:KAP family P-loop domain